MERDVLKAVDHRHIVSLNDAFEYDGKAFPILELCPHGTLKEYMRRSGRLPENDVKVFGRALVRGVTHLHKMGFIHRDLKPENILLGTKGSAIPRSAKEGFDETRPVHVDEEMGKTYQK